MRVPLRSSGRGERQLVAPWALLAALVALTLSGCSTDGTGQLTETAARRPDDWPSVTIEESTVPLGQPPVVADGRGQFAFVATQPGTTDPVAWDPCRPIHYVVNPEDGPTNGADLIAEAVAATAEATGLTFTDDGTTDETWTRTRERHQPERYGDRWSPVLISWAHESTAPVLSGLVAGRSGASSVRPPGRDEFVYVSGWIVLDALLTHAATASQQGATAVRALIQHELGHVLGLERVDDPNELMHTESLPEQRTDWGPGDLEGLSLLGSGDCFPDA